ncbi:MAG: hypothetical protein LC635_00505 [Pseudonocardiaceae bacterium]|nr:hypothetical protein [Pseudonocardiaceae bacterium]
METLIGFVIGYVVGSRQGRDGLQKARESFDAIRSSPEVQQLMATGVSIAGTTMKQLLSGGAGPMISGVVDAVSRKATEIMGDTEGRENSRAA